jgi:predicted nucleic acid-binding protein
MNADRFVIDASVAIKWVVDERGTEQAVLLRRRPLFAPDLLIAECANILWKKVRRQELSEAEAIVAARLLQRADIQLEPMRNLLEPATRLSLTLDHPAYDCVYLALAETISCPLVTVDERLYRKCLPGSSARRVLLLGDIRE